jgi:hypothetical protein
LEWGLAANKRGLGSFQLPAGSTNKAAFVAAIKKMAARAIAAERQRESPQAGASPVTAATS